VIARDVGRTAAATRRRTGPRLAVALRIGRRVLLPASVLVGCVLLWYLLILALSLPSYILPTPLQVLRALVARRWAYLPDVWTTTREIVAGFALGLAVGLPLAVAISRTRTFRDSLYPLLISTQMVPLFALAAPLTILFSYGQMTQILVAALYAFFPIVVTTADGLSRVDPDLIVPIRAAGASEWRIFRSIRMPAALPALFSGSKLAVTFAVGGAVIGEWIGGQSGLGYWMRFQNDSLDISGMYATVVVLTLLGVTLFGIVSLAEYVLLPWHRRSRADLGNLWRGT